VVKQGFNIAIYRVKVEIQVETGLFDGEVVDRSRFVINRLRSGPILEDGIFCVLQSNIPGQQLYISVL
jgi:hypothetical protein